MKIRNNEESRFDPGGNAAPLAWYGNQTPQGASKPYCDAPLMSFYICNLSGSEAVYVRVALNNADADWQALVRAGGTVAGDITVTGTITAGDLNLTSL
jgi:hypothetical protein